MRCPNDNATLVMTDRAGVEIDYCPECRGVWLDRGELDKIIQNDSRRNDSYERRDNDSHHQSSYLHYDDDRQKPKKRESFMGDLFDF